MTASWWSIVPAWLDNTWRKRPSNPHPTAILMNPVTKQVVAALIVRGEEILCCQRSEYQALPLKWEFPGGKIEAGESAPDALARELDEELGVRARIGAKVAQLQHRYHNGNAVDLQFFVVEEYEGELQNRIF